MPLDSRTAPIFVVGTGRSGTTLLRMMLCAHPRIFLTHEASFYLTPGADATSYQMFARHYFQSFSFRWLRIDPAEVVKELAPTARPPELIQAVMRVAARREGKVRWGDKTPSHTAHLREIFRDFPDAKVVRIVRDPRAVIRSLRRMPWASASLISGAVYTGLERHSCAPFRDRMLEVRLEDLLEDPREVLAEVLSFVGEDWHDAVLEHPNHLPKHSVLPPVPWFQSATKGLSQTPRLPAVAVDPVETRLLEWLTRGYLRDHGYAQIELAHPPSVVKVALAYLKDLPEFVRSTVAVVRLVSASKKDPSGEAAATKAALAAVNPRAWDAFEGLTELPPPPPLPDGWEKLLER